MVLYSAAVVHVMAPLQTPERFATALRLAKACSLIFFSVGMALAVAEAAALLAPTALRPAVYAAIGATTALAAWRLLAFVFRTLDATRSKPKG